MTIVTALFNINRDKLDGRDWNTYLKWFSNFLKLKAPLIIFTSKDLNKGKSILCYACRVPLKSKDLINPKYEEGVSCPQCYDRSNDFKKNNFRERQKQIRLALERGETHLKMLYNE